MHKNVTPYGFVRDELNLPQKVLKNYYQNQNRKLRLLIGASDMENGGGSPNIRQEVSQHVKSNQSDYLKEG